MASTLISPGVLALENDQSQITQQPVVVGAAIVGPTVKGPVENPTIVTSYSQFQNIFGTTFTSASNVYTYFTSIAAYNYFNNGGDSLLVARVVSGSFTPSQTSTTVGSVISNGFLSTTSSVTVSSASLAPFITPTGSFSINGITINITGSVLSPNTATTIFVSSGSTPAATIGNITASFNASASLALYSSSLQYITASASGSTGLFFNSVTSLVGTTFPTSTLNSYTYISGSTTTNFSGASNLTSSFVLETFSEGIIMNSSSSLDSSGALASGSIDNIRWEIQNANTSSGTFTLLIRRGDDNTLNPTVLETWTNLSLDPFAPNYITKVIGDYDNVYNSTNNQMMLSGSFPNASRYVRVKSVTNPTPLYLDNNGIAKSGFTGYIPVNQSGSFSGATGTIATNGQYYDQITDGNRSQGIPSGSYTNMINLLANDSDYKFNVLLTPGLFNSLQTSQITTIINNTQYRGDYIYVTDLVPYNTAITSVTTQAASLNTSYAATYWPWVQVLDPDSGFRVWVPASIVIGGVYAYNDSVSEPWFAPAGINRGGLGQVIRTEQKLSQANRDTLYAAKINPLATFPGTGVVVYGQKTLQTKASALDRVNVRRLLVSLKSYISQVANNLVFEQNTIATRNSFLAQVNPYLTSVQQRQGLYAFKVVMDDSNNTADVIDRNQLIGAIYIQPTKTAEFIYLNFNILPTGVTFPV
jgi:hypothetical protein